MRITFLQGEEEPTWYKDSAFLSQYERYFDVATLFERSHFVPYPVQVTSFADCVRAEKMLSDVEHLGIVTIEPIFEADDEMQTTLCHLSMSLLPELSYCAVLVPERKDESSEEEMDIENAKLKEAIISLIGMGAILAYDGACMFVDEAARWCDDSGIVPALDHPIQAYVSKRNIEDSNGKHDIDAVDIGICSEAFMSFGKVLRSLVAEHPSWASFPIANVEYSGLYRGTMYSSAARTLECITKLLRERNKGDYQEDMLDGIEKVCHMIRYTNSDTIDSCDTLCLEIDDYEGHGAAKMLNEECALAMQACSICEGFARQVSSLQRKCVGGEISTEDVDALNLSKDAMRLKEDQFVGWDRDVPSIASVKCVDGFAEMLLEMGVDVAFKFLSDGIPAEDLTA